MNKEHWRLMLPGGEITDVVRKSYADKLEAELAQQPAMTDEVRNVILAALTEYEDARNKFWDGHPDAMRDRDEARAAIAYLDVQPKGDG